MLKCRVKLLWWSLGLCLLLVCLGSSHAIAKPKKTTVQKVKKKEFRWWEMVDVKGLYTIWALNQHGFLLGKDHPLDDADYVVQMLRMRLRFGNKQLGVVTRLDAAQGWWGVDNSPNNLERTTADKNGQLQRNSVYNPYKLFRNKDTNYMIHFDWAYFYIEVPYIPFSTRVQAGRQNFKVGNRLVLDQDLDGVQVKIQPIKPLLINFLWARVAEGDGSIKNPLGVLMNDADGRAESNLFGASLWYKSKAISVEAFGLFYGDDAASSGMVFAAAKKV